MDAKTSHLEMIQEVIKRMADSSFRLKGWSVVLVSAIFALSGKDSQTGFVLIAFLPVIAFWVLDGYFLHQEKLFRKLYDAVRAKSEKEVDFGMDTSPYKAEVPCWACVCFSSTLRIFHGAVLAVTVLATIAVLGDIFGGV